MTNIHIFRRNAILACSCSAMLMLSACVYQPDIEQGNIMTKKTVKAIHRGMSSRQVQQLLGSPLLINPYRNHRIIYVYTFKKSNHPIKKTKLIIVLHHQVVESFWTGQPPPPHLVPVTPVIKITSAKSPEAVPPPPPLTTSLPKPPPPLPITPGPTPPTPTEHVHQPSDQATGQ